MRSNQFPYGSSNHVRNGLELTSEITKNHADIPVAVTMNHSHPEYREVADAAGAAHFVRKEELSEARIGEILDSLRLQAPTLRTCTISGGTVETRDLQGPR